MYRGVYAVAFEEIVTDDAAVTQAHVFDQLLQMGAVHSGDLVLLTMGQKGVAGRTNSLQILTVPGAPPSASA
jgi:pyruvate kinase